ncbi:hypothetical protein LINPERHAP1_LOCUS1939 [Linum perenne]
MAWGQFLAGSSINLSSFIRDLRHLPGAYQRGSHGCGGLQPSAPHSKRNQRRVDFHFLQVRRRIC